MAYVFWKTFSTTLLFPLLKVKFSIAETVENSFKRNIFNKPWLMKVQTFLKNSKKAIVKKNSIIENIITSIIWCATGAQTRFFATVNGSAL